MNKFYGSVCTHSLIVSFPNYTRTELNDIFQKYGNGQELQQEKYNWNNLSKSEQYLILTDHHEFDHFFQLISSQFGILLFRLHHIIASDISWLGKEFDSLGLKIDNTGTKFTVWLQNVGLESYFSRAKLTRNKIDQYKYIKYHILPGLQNIESLLTLLTSTTLPNEYSKITVREFCSLLNSTNSYLKKHSDICIENGDGSSWTELGFQWKSKLPSDTKLFQENAPFLSYSNLLEVSAYLKEFRLLIRQGGSKSSVNSWLKERVPPEYHSLFILLLETFGSPSAARAVISSYFDSRLDICSDDCTNSNSVQFVEEEWPFFMFSSFANYNEQHIKRRRMAIKGYTNIVNRNILFGAESGWRKLDPKMYLKGMEFNSHLLTLEKTFLEAIKRKLKTKIDEDNNAYSQLYLSDLVGIIESNDDYNFRKVGSSIDMEPISMIIQLSFSVLHSYIPQIANRILHGRPIHIPIDKFERLKSSINDRYSNHLSEKLLKEFFEFLETFYQEEYMQSVFKGVSLNWFVPVKKERADTGS
jgi:hypothetical protein